MAAWIAPLRRFLHRAPLDSRRMSQGQRVYVSKSDAPQKIERRQVDWNEQSILAEPTQRRLTPDRQKPRLSRSPWPGTRGSFSSIPDSSAVRYTTKLYRYSRAQSSTDSIQQDGSPSGQNCSVLRRQRQATSRSRGSKSTKLHEGESIRLRKNDCVGRQFSSFLDDCKTVFIRYRAMAVPLQGSLP